MAVKVTVPCLRRIQPKHKLEKPLLVAEECQRSRHLLESAIDAEVRPLLWGEAEAEALVQERGQGRALLGFAAAPLRREKLVFSCMGFVQVTSIWFCAVKWFTSNLSRRGSYGAWMQCAHVCA